MISPLSLLPPRQNYTSKISLNGWDGVRCLKMRANCCASDKEGLDNCRIFINVFPLSFSFIFYFFWKWIIYFKRCYRGSWEGGGNSISPIFQIHKCLLNMKKLYIFCSLASNIWVQSLFLKGKSYPQILADAHCLAIMFVHEYIVADFKKILILTLLQPEPNPLQSRKWMH